jgi:glycosyltransferase involved in cell wall biosynthesis
LSKEKGQLLLVDAAYQLSQEGVLFELVLAGDGEMRAALETAIDRYGLTNRVRITGWISSDQVREEILAAQALVLPSFSEGLPVVIMEAMALRRPVLSTYVGGIPELVLHGETGWLFPAGSIEELTSVMRTCINTPPVILEAMGNVAYKRVMVGHSIDTEVAKLAHLYKNYRQLNTPSI